MPLAERSSPYGRSTVPVVDEAEQILGEIEGSTAILFSSGMTAWTMLCLAVLAPGRAVAISDGGYYGMETLAGALLEPWGVEVRRYPATDMDALANAANGAALALIETPMNPTLDVIDIAEAAEVAHARGAMLRLRQHRRLAAATAATRPWRRRLSAERHQVPVGALRHAGRRAVAARPGTRRAADRPAHRDRHRARARPGLAPAARAADARGSRVTAERQRARVGWAAGRARARGAVRYPGLTGDPGHELAARQMHGGFGGLLSFQLADAEAAEAVERSLQLIHPATSLGSVESLIERRGRIEPEGRVPEGLLRLSVGLEHPDDLWADLEQALANA